MKQQPKTSTKHQPSKGSILRPRQTATFCHYVKPRLTHILSMQLQITHLKNSTVKKATKTINGTE